MLKNYKELMVWQKSYRLCLGIYKITKEYIRLLYIAYGSTCELETQLLLSGDLGHLNKESLSKFQTKTRP